MWQVLDNGKVIKEYPTYMQCLLWCYEKGYVLKHFSDFAGDKEFSSFRDGIKIHETED